MATATKTKPKAPPVPESELAVQLRAVKLRASDQNAEIERLGREVKRVTSERDDALSYEEKNKALRAENKQLADRLAAAENERDTAQEYAQANEGAARRLQAIRDALS
jgi:regulator of replication initiation timing